ncbi:hypothetical protein [Streptomyces brevispora]|uniref:Uncharacterized protein n=1 Tax=Streptomyces brevispora TaxID=887462 RepID=A0ABZ1FVV4_9ACTN|nr:hypothetical protein [Streptomyces brevispora]WSC11627.1 hypothetical protein OIE64_01210 [Streptomyces brevispora]
MCSRFRRGTIAAEPQAGTSFELEPITAAFIGGFVLLSAVGLRPL